jgi:hypothetical protein
MPDTTPRPLVGYLLFITAPPEVQAEVERVLELTQPQPRPRPARRPKVARAA